MKSIRMSLVLILAAAAVSVHGATEISFSLSTTTGDNEFDLALRSINIEAQKSLPAFYSSLSLNYGVKSEEIDILLRRHRLSPADAYLALRLAFLINKPVDYVIVRYQKHKKRGWGYIARKMGIKPGSERFFRLKTGGYVVLNRTRKARRSVEVSVKAKRREGPAIHGKPDVRPEKKKGRHVKSGRGGGKGRGKR
jgi:hypothetical protein